MERKLKTLVVDDEKKALVLLQKLLEDTNEFSDIRCADSTLSVSSELKAFNPDIIFLDIKMPGKDGIELLKEIRTTGTKAEIVFVTAHNEFGLEAIRNYAFGYLPKPVNRKELSECINRFNEVRKKPDLEEKFSDFLDARQTPKLRINTRSGYFFVDPDEILYCQADGNYSNIHTTDKHHICSLQLGVVEDMLPANGFMRLGRSLIINFKYVASVDRKKYQVLFEKLGRSWSVSVSPTQLKELERRQGG